MDPLDQKVNTEELETRVKEVYTDVAEKPKAAYHFEMGRGLAEKLGYPPEVLGRIPAEAIESFAGVGHHFDLAELKPGEHVLDLGSGSGTDIFAAALAVGPGGGVVGVDMTDRQLAKAEHLRGEGNFTNVSLIKGYIESLPVADASFDVLISNGVINLSAEKPKVFAEARRVLKPGGRLAISDIVSSRPLSERIKSSAELWAACIGGAVPLWEYFRLIESADLTLIRYRSNPSYRFLTHDEVMEKYGIKSISLLAQKT